MGEMEGASLSFFYLHLLHSHLAFFEIEGSAEARGAHPANHDVAQEFGLKILGSGSTLRFDGGVETTQIAETHTLAIEQGFEGVDAGLFDDGRSIGSSGCTGVRNLVAEGGETHLSLLNFLGVVLHTFVNRILSLDYFVL